jgi:putative transposase
MEPQPPAISELGLLTLSSEAWEQIRQQSQVIAPLAALHSISHQAADTAALQLGLSRRQIYVLVRRYRQGEGLLTDLIPGKSNGGKNKGRLLEPVERLISEFLHKHFMTRQKPRLSALYRDIAYACKVQNLPVPARNTVALRISKINPIKLRSRREGMDATRSLQSAGGIVPPILAPLDQVQIDHTVIDLIIVDERDRQPIGRPYLTVAIDVYSRCILGMVVTLEAPSAVSVGLCLAHVVCDKRPWLELLGSEVDWPMSGKPKQLYVDNAAEFKSEALHRGCEQHGVKLNYRPLGQPHYGGIVERVIGTVMQRVHELPGTTFSNPVQRGKYDSERMATLTLRELERWLILAIASYHGTVHESLHQTPAFCWSDGINCSGAPMVITQSTAFLVDFLPVIRRTLTRTGFVIDHIHYYADVLKPWIAERDKLHKFLIRRDPRDISRVWVLEPTNQYYVEIPYRTLSHPAVTLWEQKQAMAQLRQRGREQVDESTLFRMIQQMRNITHTAQKVTRKVRRDNERRQHIKKAIPFIAPKPPIYEGTEVPTKETLPIAPFKQIEEW